MDIWSSPAWGRGLKFPFPVKSPTPELVVPRVGTWIEIFKCPDNSSYPYVVPRVGTWIEIVRGNADATLKKVVPRVGTWIEILKTVALGNGSSCRPPRGDVD